jgi:DNA-binding HxlR family transcriptional regulator
MVKRGPLPNNEQQRYVVLAHLPTEGGVGFNELWRNLKSNGVGMSFSTLTKALKSLSEENCVSVELHGSESKIPRHLYKKVESGIAYEQYLRDRLGLESVPTKRTVKIHKGEIRYDRIIFGEIPYTCEIELSSTDLDKKKEDEISRFVQTASSTIVPTVAEILNKAYTGFISLLGQGSKREAVRFLSNGLSFKLKLTLMYDGSKTPFDQDCSLLLQNDKELSEVTEAIASPSHIELLGCWMLSLLKPLVPPERFPYDLSDNEGWARFITDQSNQWRREKGLPLLEQKGVRRFLDEQISKGFISIKHIRSEYGMLEFNEKMPEPQPEEFYSFILNLLGSIGFLLDETDAVSNNLCC